MICDPQIEVICDECGDSEMVTPKYTYHDYSGNSGQFECDDSDVISMLDGWVLDDDGKVTCSECLIEEKA